VPLLRGEPLDLPAFTETRPKVASRGTFERYRVRVPGVPGKLRSIRRGDFKLTLFPTPDGAETELYDVERDPDESRDLKNEMPQLTRKMYRELAEWFAAYAAADTAPLDLEDEDLESLRALGYID
jgi:arylsulfatase A-like enzyme